MIKYAADIIGKAREKLEKTLPKLYPLGFLKVNLNILQEANC